MVAVGAFLFVRVVGRFLLDDSEVTVVLLQFERLPSGTSLIVELSGGTGVFSDSGGHKQVNSLVLEVQELGCKNLKSYSTTYVRRSSVTESS